MARDLIRQVSGYIERYAMLSPRETVIVAISGGADSVCLLLVLKELGYRVCAVHVEHGIRGQESMDDCKFVEGLCADVSVPLVVRHIDVPALSGKSGTTLEEAARDARYRILMEETDNFGAITVATAHNMSDQAETVLWNLIRGSGIAGLSGIPPVRVLAEGKRLVRPLLGCDRCMIEEWLKERGQSYRIDRTNGDVSITRNAIRLRVIPVLRELNRGAVAHIAASAAELRETSEYMSEVTERVFREAADNGVVRLDRLEDVPSAIRGKVLRRAVEESEGSLRDITREHIISLMGLLNMDNGHSVSLPRGVRAFREEGVIRFARRVNPASSAYEIAIDHDGSYHFPSCTRGGIEGAEAVSLICRHGIFIGTQIPRKKYTKFLAYDTMGPCLCLRNRRLGDYIIVNRDGGRRKLKDYLIDKKVPRDVRDLIPLVAQGSHVLWVIGYRISEGAKVREGSHYIDASVSFSNKTDGGIT